MKINTANHITNFNSGSKAEVYFRTTYTTQPINMPPNIPLCLTYYCLLFGVLLTANPLHLLEYNLIRNTHVTIHEE